MDKYERILGGLIGGAVGDAMGAATETRSTAQIKEKFGGLVTEFLPIPNDVFARGFETGSVTDDFSLAYETARAIVDKNGVIDAETANNALINWSETKYYALAGPTTRAALDRIKGLVPPETEHFPAVDNAKGSNGGGMKISTVGLASGGDVDKAIKDAITICMPTHNNSSALAGACAVAAAVACAMNDGATLEDVIEAGVKGAEAGDVEGKRIGKELANPSIPKRIRLAVEIGKAHKDNLEDAMREIIDIIGAGLAAAEAIPAAFGLLAATDADPMQAIIGGVNIGNDTDTVATMAGAIAGTMKGAAAFDPKYTKIIDEVNGYDLAGMAKKLCEVC